MRVAARDRRLLAALPDVLDGLAADLRSGGGLLAAIGGVAAGSGPLTADFARIADRVAAGATLADSIAAWPGERPLPAVAAAAAALEMAATVGGRSASALEGLAGGLRDQADARQEAAALSAQARLSALVVGLAPLGSLGFALLADRRVPAALVGSGAGRLCLAAGLGLDGLAFLWMRRILGVALPPVGPAPKWRRFPAPYAEKRRQLREATRLAEGVPLTADVLGVSLAAGLTPYLALRVAARSAPGAVAVHLSAVLEAVDHGDRLVDALAARSDAAPALRPLLAVLLASEELGAPAGPALTRLAADGRARIRRAALERARTLPVRLLFPLVFLVLPAFVLLTVGPVLLAGLAL